MDVALIWTHRQYASVDAMLAQEPFGHQVFVRTFVPLGRGFDGQSTEADAVGTVAVSEGRTVVGAEERK